MKGKLYDAYVAYSDKLKYKLGDAIKYVMLEEFKDVTMTSILNYYAVVAFLYLYELISEKTLKFFKQIIVSAQDESFEQQELCRLFVRNLMRDPKFKKLISIDDSFEKSLDDLNRFEMDSWIVTNGFELYELVPKTFMKAHELFFFKENNGRSTFMVINIDHIHASTNLEYEAEYISERYKDFADYNKKAHGNTFLLKYRNMTEYYCKYTHDTRSEICSYGEIIGFAGDDKVVSVIKKDGEYWVCYKDFDDKKDYETLIKYESDMQYIVKTDYVLVFAKKGTSKRFIKPYRVYYDGRIGEPSNEEAITVLWERLCEMTVGNITNDIGYYTKHRIIQLEEFKKIPEKLTLIFLWKKFLSYEQGEGGKVDRFIHMLKLIRCNLSDDTDFLEQLYVMIDVSLKEKTSYLRGIFPAENMYKDILLQCHQEVLKDNVIDADKFRKELYARLDLEQVKPPSVSFENPVVGTFGIDENNGELKIELVAWDECEILGTMIVPKCRKYEGVVTIDTNTGTYCFNYPKVLSDEVKKSIIERFDLDVYGILWTNMNTI